MDHVILLVHVLETVREHGHIDLHVLLIKEAALRAVIFKLAT